MTTLESSLVADLESTTNSTALLQSVGDVVGMLAARGIHPAIVEAFALLAAALQAHKAEAEAAAASVAGSAIDAAAQDLSAKKSEASPASSSTTPPSSGAANGPASSP